LPSKKGMSYVTYPVRVRVKRCHVSRLIGLVSIVTNVIRGVYIGKSLPTWGGGGDANNVVWVQNRKAGKRKRRKCEGKKEKRQKIKKNLNFKRVK
jgi:hypothetical protein